jgi:hypothetical protein
MTETQLYDVFNKLFVDLPVLAILLWGWLSERKARIEAQVKYQELLLKLSKVEY